ncbi:MAG: hypothetical protein AVO39_06910 [delta proteobacterium MLS_D]|jgi:drug/metabolite transporter (DMT)-like permease|nr:MAG: hypothetical protein AVO39_06910 [delta proteobacterium MLS_D]
MNDWYLFSLIALVLFGLQRFLYKVSAEEGCNSAITTLAFMGTVTCLSTLFFLFSRGTINNTSFLVGISIVNGLSFLTGTLASMEALKRIPATTVLPLIRLNTLLVVLFGIFYFGDKLSMYQYGGIVISLAVIITLARFSPALPSAGQRETGSGIVYAAVALVAGAVAAVSSAFAALSVDKLAFMALSYLFGTVFSFALYHRRAFTGSAVMVRKAVGIGICIGIINFAGFYALLHALATGPVSVIIPATGLYFVIAVLLSVVVYREKLDVIRFSALVMTVAAVILLRL